jgi:hypothetical protein
VQGSVLGDAAWPLQAVAETISQVDDKYDLECTAYLHRFLDLRIWDANYRSIAL